MAKHMIEKGHIRTAIVGGCNLVQRPNLSLQLKGLGVLNDGIETRSFSEDGEYNIFTYIIGYNEIRTLILWLNKNLNFFCLFFLSGWFQQVRIVRSHFATKFIRRKTIIWHDNECKNGTVRRSQRSIYQLLF